MNNWGKEPKSFLPGLGEIQPTVLPKFNPLSGGIVKSTNPPNQKSIAKRAKSQPQHNFKTYQPPPSHNFKTYQPKFEFGKPKPFTPHDKPDITPEPKSGSLIPYADVINDNKPAPFVPYADPKLAEPRNEFMRIFNQLTSRFKPREVWNDYITTFACAISNLADASHYKEREAFHLETSEKYDKTELALFAELARRTVLALKRDSNQDFLGEIFEELGLDRYNAVTPYPMCQHVVGQMIDERDVVAHIKKEGYFSMLDMFCGSGATMIATANALKRPIEQAGLNWKDHVLLIGQDIDPIAGMMSYIQLSILGAASYIKIGDTFNNFMSPNDTLENYWFTPVCFSKKWCERWLSGEAAPLSGNVPKRLKDKGN